MAESQPTRRLVPIPGTDGRRERGGASGWVAVCTIGRARSGRRGASAPLRSQAPSRLLGTAGAGQRAARPARGAVLALCVPLAGRLDGRWVVGP